MVIAEEVECGIFISMETPEAVICISEDKLIYHLSHAHANEELEEEKRGKATSQHTGKDGGSAQRSDMRSHYKRSAGKTSLR